jgi:hypothetical protein
MFVQFVEKLNQLFFENVVIYVLQQGHHLQEKYILLDLKNALQRHDDYTYIEDIATIILYTYFELVRLFLDYSN